MKDSNQTEFFQHLLRQDSPARTFQSQEKQKVSTENNQDCSLKLFDSFAQFDQNSSSWKTYQRCLLGGWELYLESFPRSGMTVNGIALRLQVLVDCTAEIGSGLWATPVTHNGQEGGFPGEWRRDSPNLTCEAIIGKPSKSWTKEDFANQRRGKLNPDWVEFLMGYPVGWTDLGN